MQRSMMFYTFISLLLSIPTGLALTCYSCDSYQTCSQPRIEMCPASSQCYTLRQRGGGGMMMQQQGQVVGLGCALSCQYLPMATQSMVDCSTCNNQNNCNSPQMGGIGQGVQPQPYGQPYNPGSGVQPGGYNSGQGQYGAYGSQNSGSGYQYNPNNQQRPGYGGYNPGGGVVPNNQYQPGHGVQPRAANPMSILAAFAVTTVAVLIL